MFESELLSTTTGIYLPENQAKMIWTKTKKLIVDPVGYNGVAGKDHYLIGGNLCYGVIRINKVVPITLEKFRQLSEFHKVTDNERESLWKGKKQFFAYPFDLVKRFDPPKQIAANKGANLFSSDVRFLAEELIQNIVGYDPHKVDNKVLADDFRIALAWWSTKQKNPSFRHSIEEIENLIQLIMEEMARRGLEFHPETYAPETRKVFDKISAKIGKSLSASPAVSISKEFKDAIIIKDFASIVGSAAEKPGYNDIDIIFRLSSPSDFIKRAVEARLTKMHKLDKPLHFIWGDSEGPHDSFVPIYDLALVKRDSKVIEMSDSVSPMSSFLPMKPGKKFYDIKEAVAYAYGR
jgi:hypothetical protein